MDSERSPCDNLLRLFAPVLIAITARAAHSLFHTLELGLDLNGLRRNEHRMRDNVIARKDDVIPFIFYPRHLPVEIVLTGKGKTNETGGCAQVPRNGSAKGVLKLDGYTPIDRCVSDASFDWLADVAPVNLELVGLPPLNLQLGRRGICARETISKGT
jgi:hypothetical protein